MEHTDQGEFIDIGNNLVEFGVGVFSGVGYEANT